MSGSPDRAPAPESAPEPAPDGAVPAHARAAPGLAERLLDAVPDAIVVFDRNLEIRYANRAAMSFIGADDDQTPQLAGPVDGAMLIHPDDRHRGAEALLEVALSPGSRRTIRARIVNGCEARPIEANLVNMLDDQGVEGIVVSFRDLRAEVALQQEADARQRLLEHNDTLHTELLERQAFQARLLQIQQSISRRQPVNDVLLAVVQGAHDLLGDEIVELRLDALDADGEPTAVESLAGSSRFVEPASLRLGPPALGEAARRADRLVAWDEPDAPASTAPVGTPTAGMAVPIRDRDRILGSLTVATREAGRHYRDVEREMLVNLAAHASVALMDARTVEHVQAALTDPLTGLPNRALLMDRLTQSIERSARHLSPLAVMFVDLSRFKGINDSYGHAVGDEVLATVGHRIGEVLRTHDTAARIGGDEFVVVLESTDADGARGVAERLLAAVRQPIPVGTRTMYADATIGIVVSLDGARVDPELLLRHADIAMYRAKTAGAGVVFFESSMQSELLARQELEQDLRGAISSRRLHAVLQPVVDLATREVVAVEALARWPRPDDPDVTTNEFVTTAERIGAVAELDRLVWADACRQVAALPANAAGQLLSLSLNISAKHLVAPDLVDVLGAIAGEARLDPSRLTLEITETELMLDVVAAVEQMWALRRLGVHLAIDDFGTGYSSLAYLQALPVRMLKIDRTFISGVDRSSTRHQLAQTMVNLAHGLELSVVAEGIETEAEAAAMQAMGADLGQGFWLAHPLSGDALRELLAAAPSVR